MNKNGGKWHEIMEKYIFRDFDLAKLQLLDSNEILHILYMVYVD